MTGRFDVIVIGAGIAGASVAYFLGDRARVLILESEDHPGMHSTGRSAAFYAETYGGRLVQPLTTASKPFFFDPPAGFADTPLVSPRGALHVSSPDDDALLDALAEEFEGSGVTVEHFGAAAAAAAAPLLAPDWRRRALWEPGCRDIDVAALHMGFLSGSRRQGARMVCAAPAQEIVRDGGRWHVATPAGRFEADVVVNAAGAWADVVAMLAGVQPLRIQPMRRTVVVADIGMRPKADLPLVIDAAGKLYFKPDAGQMWISPHDETPCVAADAQPDELDIAVAVDRFERATDARVRRVVRSWAGLRSFSPDRLPVYGFAGETPGFFWCAGQGGFGIQTAPAAGEMAASLVLGAYSKTPGVEPGRYAPDRFG